MRRVHRSSHVGVVLASALLAGAALGYGWSARAARPVPQPVSGEAHASEAPLWDVAFRTHAGTARFTLLPRADESRAMRVALPRGLDAAEPGVVLEREGAAPRVLGSLSAGRLVIPVTERLTGGERLVLVDLARDVRLGEASVPEGER